MKLFSARASAVVTAVLLGTAAAGCSTTAGSGSTTASSGSIPVVHGLGPPTWW